MSRPRHRGQGLGPARGCLFGLLFSAPFWLVLGLLVWWLA